MTRAASGAGVSLRPNNWLAGVLGSSGFCRGGSGFFSSVPMSCAAAVPQPAASKRRQRRRGRTMNLLTQAQQAWKVKAPENAQQYERLYRAAEVRLINHGCGAYGALGG